ncbi:unnamed protein product [Brassica napus]|uniref:(rape) hypothetical protein n=1 Tax=Brassica napus TaxID=3708 RepID=A0A816YRM1_BRANA|nr:unnamed protein product [Brassica napus]
MDSVKPRRRWIYHIWRDYTNLHYTYTLNRIGPPLVLTQKKQQMLKPEDDATGGKPIVPCGLIAWSLFNGTYTLSRNNTPLAVNKKGIAWKSDKEHKFGNRVFPKNFQKGNRTGGATLNPDIPLSEQEDLIVWMRTAALPTFRKLYGKIETDLENGDTIHVTVQNNYNTYSFSGKKKLVLLTTSWLGGKNNFLGIDEKLKLHLMGIY